MEARIRRQLERARRVAEFSRQYPSTLPGYGSAVARLEERLTRTTVVLDMESGNHLVGRAAVAKRVALRERLTADLRFVAALARTAGAESIGTPIVIRYPGPERNLVQFVSGARLAVAKATEEMELLQGYGLTVEHLAGISAGLAEFDRLVAEQGTATRDHIAARLELRTLAREMRIVIDQLHAFNRHRFRNDRAALGAWNSVRAVRLVTRSPAPPGVVSQVPLSLPAGSGSEGPNR